MLFLFSRIGKKSERQSTRMPVKSWFSLSFLCVFFLVFSHTYAASSLPNPPSDWKFEEDNSLYMRLYHSSQDLLDLQGFYALNIEEADPVDLDADGIVNFEVERGTRWITDRIITAVAADLVVEDYKAGTNPMYDYDEDRIVWRTKGLTEIPPEELDLGVDDDGEPYQFKDVKLWIRDALAINAEEACRKWPPWWLSAGPDPERLPNESEGALRLIPNCITFVQDVRRAIEDERELRLLRQDLSLIAYGQESLWDGQLDSLVLEARDTFIPQLRTYDLLMDIA